MSLTAPWTITPQAACRFIETGDMGAVTERVNISGRPLDANEEFDREE